MPRTRCTSRNVSNAPQPKQSGIKAYSRVSKPSHNGEATDKITATGTDSLKRRMPTPDPVEDVETQSSAKRRRVEDPSVRTPRKSQKLIEYLPTPENTPEKDRTLHIVKESTSPLRIPRGGKSAELPEAIQEIVRLYTSMLRALSLHYAHNGVASPVDVGTLISSASRIWGKRTITLDDISRCFGIQDAGFKLVDYGRGRVCIERPETDTRTVVPQALDEDRLGRLFSLRLDELWREHSRTSEVLAEEDEVVEGFITSLPKSKITAAPTLEKVAPIFSLGKRRFEDFKRSQSKSTESPTTRAPNDSIEQESPSTSSNTSESKSKSLPSKPTPRRSTIAPRKTTPASSSLANRQSTLLARLSEKSAKKSLERASKNELTKSDLARRAALFRLPEVAGTLPLPRAASMRTTYTLRELVQQLRDSSRSVMGVEEVEMCLRVLAEQGIGGGWLKIVETFTKDRGLAGVVLDHSRRVDTVELGNRVRLELDRIGQ